MSKVEGIVQDATSDCAASGRNPLALFQRFKRDESGALLIFGLFLFVLMIMMGGLAVDVMRHETTRTLMQQTLDRSVLAAASRKQTLDPASVVTDYFAKAGLASYLNGVTVTEGLNFREVQADASADTHPFFMHMMGIDDFTAAAGSTAEERITNVEIALVLDISGSMIKDSSGNALPEPNKMTNLKAAASEFVDTVLTGDTDNRVSIAVVPYNGQVNLGATLRQKYNFQDDINQAPPVGLPAGSTAPDVNCLDLPAPAYNDVSLSRNLAMPMTGDVDTYSATTMNGTYYSYTDSSRGVPSILNKWCPAYASNIVRLPSHNATTLKANINAMQAIGATSINAGVRWGLALLDPGSRAMFAELQGSGDIPAYFTGRPFDYTDPEAMKVIVLMTDGSHFAEERVNEGYRVGLSKIYRSNVDQNFSVYHPGASGVNKYYVPHLNTWRAVAWSNSSNTGGFTEQTWPQVWRAARMQWVAWQLFAKPLGADAAGRAVLYTKQMNLFRTKTGTSTDVSAMDAQLQQVCNLARDNNVVVFGIAFEAPTAGKTQIRNCSFKPSYYFEAGPPPAPSIQTVFRQIASQISQLRLTQ